MLWGCDWRTHPAMSFYIAHRSFLVLRRELCAGFAVGFRWVNMMLDHLDGCFLKWWYPQNTPKYPKWSFLVGKPIVIGYHHFRKPPDMSRDQLANSTVNDVDISDEIPFRWNKYYTQLLKETRISMNQLDLHSRFLRSRSGWAKGAIWIAHAFVFRSCDLTRPNFPQKVANRKGNSGLFQGNLDWWNIILGGGFRCFLFSSLPGEMIQFD